MSGFRRLCLWIDDSWADDSGRLAALMGITPLLGVLVFGLLWMIPSIGFAAFWMGLMIWRWTVIARTGLVGADKEDLRKARNG